MAPESPHVGPPMALSLSLTVELELFTVIREERKGQN